MQNVLTGEEFALKCFNKFLLRKRTKLLRLPNGSKNVLGLSERKEEGRDKEEKGGREEVEEGRREEEGGKGEGGRREEERRRE